MFVRGRNYLPCIVASKLHDQHHSVVPILSRNWKGVLSEEIYSWKGSFVRSAIHGLDRDDFVEQMNGMLSAVFQRAATLAVYTQEKGLAATISLESGENRKNVDLQAREAGAAE